jgi:hypothetical protein
MREGGPYHSDDGARREVVHQAGEERLLREISVVLLSELLGGLDHLLITNGGGAGSYTRSRAKAITEIGLRGGNVP